VAIRESHHAGDVTDSFFRFIVSGMRNGVLAVTRSGMLALINDEAYRIFGLTQSPGDLGSPVSEVLRAHPDIVRILHGVCDMHHPPNRVELRLRPSGKVIGYTLAHVRDDSGTVVGAGMFFKDLTRVEQLVERERLRDRLVAVGELAAVFAHEVKNPLAGIEVMAGLLRRKLGSSPEAQTLLTDIINEAKMANSIVQEVLDFVRPIRLQLERTSLQEAVRAATRLANSKARADNVAVTLDLPDDLPLIQADPHQLTQVFTNLLTNAYEAMGGEGRVLVSAELVRIEDDADGRDALCIQVTDNGPGMTQEVADKVFDFFYTTKPQGSGLGLAVVRKIIHGHDGRIDLETGPARGTTVRITLPLAGSEDAPAYDER
jgi:signal transduction histidine kinase